MSNCTCECAHNVHTYLLLSLPVKGAKLPFQQVVEAEEVSHLTTAVQEAAEGWNSLVRDIGTCKYTGIWLFSILNKSLVPSEGGRSHIQPLSKLVNTTLFSILYNVQE